MIRTKRLQSLFLAFSLYWLPASVAFAASQSAITPVMVIVIDDLGDNRGKGLAAINLAGDITYAILPHTPHAKALAKKAHQLGKEVILHAPMESKSGFRLGPGALEQKQDAAQLKSILNSDFDSIPFVSGINNHMGSLLTEDREKMMDVMDIVHQRNLFFLDSVTTPKTVAWKVAREYGIPYLLRDVFLDNEQNEEYIHQQFKLAVKEATKKGYAVAIGHPYPETIQYLEKALPIIDQLGIKLISASELIRIRTGKPLLLVEKQPHPCDQHEGHCPKDAVPLDSANSY